MPSKSPNFSFASCSISFLFTFASTGLCMYKSFITLRTQTSIGNTSNLFNVENNSMQSATFGPTPDRVRSSFLIFFVLFSCFNFSKSTSPFTIFLVVSNIYLSLKPKPNALKSSILAVANASGVGNM